MGKIIILVIFIILTNTSLFAQDSRSIGAKSKCNPGFAVSSEQTKARLLAFNKHPYNIYYDRLIVEYEQRMNANVRKYRIMARKMKKPQYSDPSYFGHKRKPKKRPVGKRKYCKECEIVH